MAPLPSGAPSLLLEFDDRGQRIRLGAVIIAEARKPLMPGAVDMTVELHFWANEARIYVIPGASFNLWYGRHVGQGEVTAVVSTQ